MIKSSFKLILAALAATAALMACTKEITPGQVDTDPKAPQTEGTRVIAVSFAPQTKTTLDKDGFTPKFVNGDEILLVSYPKDSEPIKDTCIVSVDDKGIATISTDLTGDLVALYPAKYARKLGGKMGLPVPAVQTGKFADANFCGGNIKDGDKSATFQNGTTLFIINPPSGAKNLTVKSLQMVTSSGQRTGYRNEINLSENEDERYSISIPNGPDEDGKYYVALQYGFNLSDLSFEVEYETSGTGAIKGIPTSVIQAQATALNKEYDEYNAIMPGTAYTIDGNNWHEYVEINGLKWATRNIGATTDTGTDSYGYHFFWGGPEGYKHIDDGENSRWVKASDNTVLPGGFISTNTPYYENSIYIKYTGTGGDDKTILDLADDAANANWGGAWRMPTGGEDGEFKALYEATTWTAEDSGYYLTKKNEDLESDKSNALLFFPAACLGDGNALVNSSNGYYLSNTLHISNSDYEYILHISISEADPQSSHTRQEGCSVRAIIDEPEIKDKKEK